MSQIPPLSLNVQAATPLSRQLYDGLRDAIAAGQFRAGTRLPSTRSLADSLGISRNTVHTAYEQLVSEGFLIGRQGAGTFVAEEPAAALSAPTANRPAAQRGRRQISDSGRALETLVSEWPHAVVPSGKRRPRAFGMAAPPDLFPNRIWRKLLMQSWDALAADRGTRRAEHMPLKEAIAEHLGTTRGVRCSARQVLVVSGSQQGIALSANVLLNPDDAVWIEDPGYFGANFAFVGRGAQVVPVAVDDDGLNVQQGIRQAPRARLVHVTPTHQFPLGVTMPLSRRVELLHWAREAEAWILEDDYDSEFRYRGKPLAALQGFDQDERVIYMGSFSKALFSGLRLAYLIVPEDLLPAFHAARQAAGGPPPVLEQAVLARFLAEGHFDRHVRRMRRTYAQRQRRLVAAVRAELDGLIDVTPDETGMHLVGWVRNGMTGTQVCELAAAAGLELLPLSSYRSAPGPEGVLMGFSQVGERALARGVRVLRDALRQEPVATVAAGKLR